MNQFGTLVRESRETSNLSFAELSRAIEKKGGGQVSRSQLCLLEGGMRIPTMDLAYYIGRALNIDLQTVISAALNDRLMHVYEREVIATEKFIKGHRLGKKLDVVRLVSRIHDQIRDAYKYDVTSA